MTARATWQGHNIEISVHLSPRSSFLATENLVKIDRREVAQFGEFSSKSHIVGTFDHQQGTAQIEIQTKPGLFLPSYLVKIDEQVVMQGYLGVETIGIMRIYFGVFGLGCVMPLVDSTLPLFRYFLFKMYDPHWLMVGAGINAIFGAFFLYVAVSLKSLLLKSLRLLTTVLYIYIGFMVATTPAFIFKISSRHKHRRFRLANWTWLASNVHLVVWVCSD